MESNINKNFKKIKKSARRRSREFALQALYQWLVNRQEIAAIDSYTRDLQGFNKSELEHYSRMIEGAVAQYEELNLVIEPNLDREQNHVSPIEYACILLGTFELKNCLEIPYKVVINEYVELAKSFGGSDGFRFVNGILHNVASHHWRQIEIAASVQ